MALCGELALEEAMSLSTERLRDNDDDDDDDDDDDILVFTFLGHLPARQRC
jgi:hypothetical protein